MRKFVGKNPHTFSNGAPKVKHDTIGFIILTRHTLLKHGILYTSPEEPRHGKLYIVSNDLVIMDDKKIIELLKKDAAKLRLKTKPRKILSFNGLEIDEEKAIAEMEAGTEVGEKLLNIIRPYFNSERGENYAKRHSDIT